MIEENLKLKKDLKKASKALVKAEEENRELNNKLNCRSEHLNKMEHYLDGFKNEITKLKEIQESKDLTFAGTPLVTQDEESSHRSIIGALLSRKRGQDGNESERDEGNLLLAF